MERVSVAAYEPIEVEINGAVFESVDPTEADNDKIRKASEDLDGLLYEIREREDSDEKIGLEEQRKLQKKVEDATREYRFVIFDILLRPIEGGKSKPSTVLKAGLKSGAITPRQFDNLEDAVPLAIQKANGVPKDDEGGLRPT